MIAIYILSFQGPDGGLTFPMNGVSLVWFGKVFSGAGIVDIGAAFKRSLKLGLVVMVLTVLFSVSAGLAFRKSFRGATFLFYVAIASLIMPSIITSLGIALEFRLLDDFIIKGGADAVLFDISGGTLVFNDNKYEVLRGNLSFDNATKIDPVIDLVARTEIQGFNVTLNLGSLVTNLANQVGIGSQLAEKLPADAGQVTISPP